MASASRVNACGCIVVEATAPGIDRAALRSSTMDSPFVADSVCDCPSALESGASGAVAVAAVALPGNARVGRVVICISATMDDAPIAAARSIVRRGDAAGMRFAGTVACRGGWR